VFRLTKSIVSGGAGSDEGLRSMMASSRSVFDLVVVGRTPAGIAMAVRAFRGGLRGLLTNRGPHPGGMPIGGLGVWDTLLEGRRVPVYDEVRKLIEEHYRVTHGESSPQQAASLPGRGGRRNGCFEPSLAERVLNRLVNAEPGLTVWRDCVPTEVRNRRREYGPARDEFSDNGHRPYEFYLRETQAANGLLLDAFNSLTSGDDTAVAGPCSYGL